MQPVTLDTLAGGALAELFAEELTRILTNIADPNTDTSARAITITVKFKPDRNRESADVSLKCTSTLAGLLSVETKLYFGKKQGRLIAVESDPHQSGLFDAEQPTPLSAFQQPERE